MDPASRERRGRPWRSFLAGLSDGIGCLRAEVRADTDHMLIMEEAMILWDYLLEQEVTLESILGVSEAEVRLTCPAESARKIGEATAVSAVTGELVAFATRQLHHGVVAERFFIGSYPCIPDYLERLQWHEKYLLTEHGELITSGYSLPENVSPERLSTMGDVLEHEGTDASVLAPRPASPFAYDTGDMLCNVFLDPQSPSPDTVWQQWLLINWVFPPNAPRLELFDVSIER